MQTEEILAAISKQISDWQRAHDLLADTLAPEAPAVRRGRPKGSTNKPAVTPSKAQKKRWAALKKPTKPAAKKATAKKSPAKKVSAKTKATKKTAAVEQQAG